MKTETTAPGKLLDNLPAIYHDDQEFLSAYLSAFERILLGRNDGTTIPAVTAGTSSENALQSEVSHASPQSLFELMRAGAERRSLEETIDLISVLFDPLNTPKDFLPWLAGWAALSLRADLSEGAQRGFIANIIQLYRRRGTKENLIKLLGIFTQTTPEIHEDALPSEFFKDKHPQFRDPKFKTTPPLNFFKVSVVLSDPDQETVRVKTEIAQALIELEKPAHTVFELETSFASMRIGDYPDKGKYRASLGVDTLINVWNKANDDALAKEKVKEKDNAGT